MITIETLSLDTTAKSIYILLQEARGGAANLPVPAPPVRSILFRSLGSEEVFVSEATTNTPVPLLSPDEDQTFATLDASALQDILLHSASPTTVGVVITM